MYQTELDIIGSALLTRNNLDKVMMLDESYFFNNSLKEVFQVIQNLYNSGQGVDLSTIYPNLKNKEIFNELVKTKGSIDISYLIDKLRKRKDEHEIKLYAQDIYNSIKKGMGYEQFVDKIVNIRDAKYLEKDSYGDLCDFKNLEIKKIFKRNRFIRTGLPTLDQKIIGFFRTHTSIIGARPGLGKTTLILQIAKNYKTLFFSLEMTRQELYAKLLSAMAKVECWKIETRKYDSIEEKRIKEAHEKLCKTLNITVFDSDLNYAQIINYINNMVRIKKPDLIIVDHIGLVGGAPGVNQNERLTNISRSFKLMAKRHDLPFVIISQFSRDVEKTKREPVLSDLRDSGSLEQDAGLVLFLHETEDDYYMICAKNKKGPVGKIHGIKFIKEYSFFDDVGEYL